MRIRRSSLLAVALVLASGCGATEAASAPSTRASGFGTAVPVTTSSTQPPTTKVAASPVPPASLKIMELGDSITEGFYYRTPLSVRVTAAVCRVDFVGSQNQPAGAPGLVDPDHEGHGGFRADQIADGARAWATAAAPDIVLLHVGTNDFYQNQDVASTVVDVKRIVTELKAARPQVQILIAQIIPGGGIEKKVSDLNAAIVSLAEDPSITIVDQNSGIDAAKDTVDGAHPNQALGERMGQRWFEALRRTLQPVCSR